MSKIWTTQIRARRTKRSLGRAVGGLANLSEVTLTSVDLEEIIVSQTGVIEIMICFQSNATKKRRRYLDSKILSPNLWKKIVRKILHFDWLASIQ